MPETKKTKVLLVEDEAIIALSEQKTLEHAGFEVETAHSGERALKLGTSDPTISLILMDIDLGRGMDGTEAATRILENRRLPIVFLTSHAEQEVVDRVKGITRYGYVLKNSGPFVLVESVHMGLELFEAHEESRRHADRVQQLNRTYQVLSDVNQAIVRVQSTSTLLDSICDIAVDRGDFLFAWVGQPQHESTQIAPVAMSGEDHGYVSSMHIDLTDPVLRDDPVGRAYRLGSAEVVGDMETDPRMAPWKRAARETSARSLAALPVRVFDEVRYVLALYAPTADFFDENELRLLDELVMDLGFAIEVRENDERREQAERQNREWQELLAYVIEHDPSAIAVLDTDLRHIYVSRRFREDYQLSDAELIGRHHYDVFPEVPEKWRRVHSRALAGEVLRSEDDHFVRADGSVDYTRWECRPWYRTGDEIGGIVLYTEAVTSMKTAEENRRTVLGALESLLSNSPDLVSIIGADGRYWMVSDSVAETIGRPKDEIIGRTLEELLPDTIAAEFRSRVDRVVASGAGFSTTDTVPSADGERTFQTSLFPSREVDGQVTMVGVISVDTTETVRMRKQLADTERRWQYAVEGAGDGLWDWDAATNRVFFSPHWKEMLGFRDDEIGDTLDEWESRIHPDDYDETFRVLEKHLRGETHEYRSEHRVRCKDGSYKWILDRGRVIERDASGSPLRVIGTHTDVDERRRLELELAESEAKYRGVAEASSFGFWILSADGTVVEANRGYCRMSGYTAGELAGMPIARLDANDDNEDVEARVSRILKSGAQKFESRHRRKDGSVFSVQVHVDRLAANSDEFLAVIEDTSDREAYQRELVLKERAFETALSGIVLTDLEGVITYANDAAARISGHASRAEIEGRPAHTFVRDVEHLDALIRDVADGTPVETELVGVRPDGEEYIMHLAASSVVDEQGNLLRLMGSFVDRTEARRAEEALRVSLEEKDTLMQELNHRVKNNLSMITSLLSLKDDALEDYLRNVVDSALSFHRESSVALDYHVEDVSLPTKLAVTLGLITNELVTNALKHAFADEDNPRVGVTFESDTRAKRYRLRISNNGGRLPADPATIDGSSLGIRLIRALVQQIGAEMEIRRDPETAFEIVIPTEA